MINQKSIPIFLFGVGNVGSTLLNQIETRFSNPQNPYASSLKVVFIANSKKALFNPEGLGFDAIQKLSTLGFENSLEEVIAILLKQEYQNPILVDATASSEFIKDYYQYIKVGFHLVAANKKANTLPIYEFQKLNVS